MPLPIAITTVSTVCPGPPIVRPVAVAAVLCWVRRLLATVTVGALAVAVVPSESDPGEPGSAPKRPRSHRLPRTASIHRPDVRDRVPDSRRPGQAGRRPPAGSALTGRAPPGSHHRSGRRLAATCQPLRAPSDGCTPARGRDLQPHRPPQVTGARSVGTGRTWIGWGVNTERYELRGGRVATRAVVVT